MERRYLQSREIRASSSNSKPQISGYASVFNSYTTITQRDGSSFRESIRRGAFTRAIRDKHDAVCLFNHDSNFVLGRVSSGTLRLRQDDHGLFYECDLPDTTLGRDLRESIKRKDISGCSFSFTVRDDGQEWSEDEDERGKRFIKRDITDVDELIDVSPVTHPAYENTEVDARELELVTTELRRKSHTTKPDIEQLRKRLSGPSFEDRLTDAAQVRRRRQNLLNELL
jgi:HK97 family phage prohead protease